MQTLAQFRVARFEPATRGGWLGVRLLGLLVLWCGLAPAPAQAMMLGQAEGALVLGQAPRMRVPVRMDPGLPLVAQCVRAELRDGDTLVPDSQLHVTVRGSDAQGWSFIDIRGARGLRAPFVQLTVHMECQFRRSRSYTLLVEPSSRVVADAQGVEPVPSVAPREPRRREGSAVARRAGDRMVSPAHPRTRGVAAQAAPRAPARPARGEGRPQLASGQPPSHLRLDWLSRELAQRRGVAPGTLAGLAPAGSAPAPAPQQEVQRLQASDAQLMQRIDAMQRQVHALQQRNAAREHELGTLRTELAQARSDPPSWRNSLFAAVGALLALVALLLWQGRRPRMDSPWPAGMLAQGAATRAGAMSSIAASGYATPATAADPAADPLAWDEPAAVPAGAASAKRRPANPTPASAASSDSQLPFDREAFQRPLSAPEHMQIDEVVDHGHLADFFIGIGDYDKAIDVMRRALDEAAGLTSALPYLYLFDLYRRCGRRADYEQLQRECAGRLNARILPWDEDPAQAPRDLLDYPRALALLTESWNGPARLTVVERMIADDPRNRRVGFDLPAYRDLLDLYALARDLQRSQQEMPQQATAQAAAQQAPASARVLDLPLRLADPVQPRPEVELRSRVGARAPEPVDPDAPTLPPLDFTMTTRPPQPWTH